MIIVPNNRLDDRVTELRKRHGMLGYGAYSWLSDMLYSHGGTLPCNYKSLAYDMHVDDEDVVRSVIEDFGLFVVKDGQFSSVEVTAYIKSEKARASAKARWRKGESECETECAMEQKAETKPQEPKKKESNQLSLFPDEEPQEPKETPTEPNGQEAEGKPPNKKRATKPFVPPTIEEVRAYMDEIGGCLFTAEAYMAKSEENGWRRSFGGKAVPITNWKNNIRVWKSNNYTYGNNNWKQAATCQHGASGGIPENPNYQDRW